MLYLSNNYDFFNKNKIIFLIEYHGIFVCLNHKKNKKNHNKFKFRLL